MPSRWPTSCRRRPSTQEHSRRTLTPQQEHTVKQGAPIKKVREVQELVTKELDVLARKHGAETFRLAALRYFKNLTERRKREAQIGKLKMELEALEK